MGSDGASVDTVILDTNIILDLYVYQDPRTLALQSMMAVEIRGPLRAGRALRRRGS